MRLRELLHVEGGYESLGTPFTVSGIPFEFPVAMLGPRTMDLVVLVDGLEDQGLGDAAPALAGLARALDLAGSRRSITAVVVGPRLDPATLRELTQYARVLRVASSGSKASNDAMRSAVSILLPLPLPESLTSTRPSWDKIREDLLGVAPSHRRAVTAIVAAADGGADSVAQAVRRWMAQDG